MNELLVGGGVLVFEPGPAWAWDGWNGEIKLQPESRGVFSGGADVGMDTDIVKLGQELVGKKYKATGFDNVAGVVTVGTVTIKPPSLSDVACSDGLKFAHAKTEGTFMITCVPSVNTSPPTPIPDPCPVKNGTWKVKQTGQSVGTST